MNWQNELQELLARASESPKAIAAVSTFSSAAGVMTAAQILTGFAAGAAVFSGLGCSLVLIRLNIIKIQNEQIKTRMLREKALEAGIDLDED
jgi:hypothetical protein